MYIVNIIAVSVCVIAAFLCWLSGMVIMFRIRNKFPIIPHERVPGQPPDMLLHHKYALGQLGKLVLWQLLPLALIYLGVLFCQLARFVIDHYM